jgi:integrase
MLSAIYKRAIELGYVRDNPAAGVRRGREDRTALPLVPADAQTKILDAMPAHLLLLVLLALDTGARQGELLRLRWADLDLKAKTILVRKAKSHRPRNLRMPERLQALLSTRSAARGTATDPNDLLFADLIGTDGRLKAWPHRQFKTAAAAAGFPSLRFHDLRHLTAINLVRGGLDLPAIQATLGHTSLQSTFRYAEYADGSAAERAAAVLDGLHDAKSRTV